MTVWASTATRDDIDRAVNSACVRAGIKPARKAHHSTAEQRAMAVELWRDGWPTKKIAYELGFRVGWVNYQVRAAVGYEARFKAVRNARISEMWMAGLTAAQIGDELGMTRTAVGAMVRLLRKRGEPLPMRPRGRFRK